MDLLVDHYFESNFMASDQQTEPWRALQRLIETDDASKIVEYLQDLPAGEISRVLSRLDAADQTRLLTIISPAATAHLLEGLPEPQAVALLNSAKPDLVVAVLHQLPSDERADLLAQLNEEHRRQVFLAMDPSFAAVSKQLSLYPASTAGGIMVTEFLAYRDSSNVADVLADLRTHVDQYSRYDVQYAYVTGKNGLLIGVLRLRDLLLSASDQKLSSIMHVVTEKVAVSASLRDLRALFNRHTFSGVPVVDDLGRLIGVVRRADIEEAEGQQAAQTFLRFSGVVGGEEFRTMPSRTRILRRLPWLMITGLLNVAAAAVIGLFEDTLSAAIALAAFLPVISGLSGNAGNQAIAVTLRELALGLIKPNEAWWVLRREVYTGVFNALVLGLALSVAAIAWRGNVYLGLVVGVALALSTLIAVCVGGSLPLLLKRRGVDPAVASSPILTTLTDVCGFVITLGFATFLLPHVRQ